MTLGASLKSIGAGAFEGCDSLSEIVINNYNNLESIGSYAFASCGSLEYVYIPESVTYMGEEVFRYSPVMICCAAESMPSGWDANWNGGYDDNVIWGNYGGEEVEPEPTPAVPWDDALESYPDYVEILAL